jgi:hypothetical protein
MDQMDQTFQSFAARSPVKKYPVMEIYSCHLGNYFRGAAAS